MDSIPTAITEFLPIVRSQLFIISQLKLGYMFGLFIDSQSALLSILRARFTATILERPRARLSRAHDDHKAPFNR